MHATSSTPTAIPSSKPGPAGPWYAHRWPWFLIHPTLPLKGLQWLLQPDVAGRFRCRCRCSTGRTGRWWWRARSASGACYLPVTPDAGFAPFNVKETTFWTSLSLAIY